MEFEDDLRGRMGLILPLAFDLEFYPRTIGSMKPAITRGSTPSRLTWLADRWGKHLEKTKTTHEPIFGPWHALASLPASDFAAGAPP